MSQRRPWYEDFDKVYDRGSRPSVAPRITNCKCKYCQSRSIPPTQPVAPTPRGVVGAALSILRNITKGAGA